MPERAFPRVHPRPAAGWLNDPNGLAHVDGRWHVFFQFHPHSARHTAVHWGHLSSPDLLTWTEEPIALTPRPGEPDAFGCWSGVVVDDAGTPTAVYSGVLDPDGDSTVLLARSDRTLRRWAQGSEPAAVAPPGITAIRDPFVLEVEGRRWAVQGAGFADGRAGVLCWSCEDLERWEYRGVVVSTDHSIGAAQAPGVVWECPQLFPLGDRWVLIVSVIEEFGRPDPGPVVALVGDVRVVAGRLEFDPERAVPVDTGPSFYAPQVLVRPDRVLLWGWSFERGRTVEEIDAAGWAGVLTAPRELSLDGDVLVSAPARELVGLRGRAVDGELPDAFEVGAGPGALRLELGGRVVVDRVVPSGARARVLVDGSLVEVFVDGAPAHTTRAYPGEGDRWAVHATDPTVRELTPPP